MSAECSAGNIPLGYKQTEVGVIPEDWDTVTLKNATVNGGLVRGPFGGALKKEIFVEHGYKVYEQRNAIYATAEIGNYYIDSNKYKELERFCVHSGDLIVSCSGTIGCVYQIPVGSPEGVINQALLKISLNKAIVNDAFFLAVFRSDSFQERIKENSHGGAMQNLVGMDVFRNTTFQLPSIAEQEAIAKALFDKDALIKSLEQLIAKKRQIKQGAMQELLTGKRRLPEFEIKRGYKKTEVGLIPEDWNLDCIENLAHITTGGKNTQDRVDDGQYPFFVRSQKIERINSYSYDGEAILTAGDGVGTGKVFHYIKGKFDAHQRVYLISEFNSQIDGYFLFLYFSNHFYNRIMQMTAKSSVDSVRREIISRMLVPLPSLSEQVAIATILSDMDSEITALEEKLAKARQIKQGMMQELLTGRVRLI